MGRYRITATEWNDEDNDLRHGFVAETDDPQYTVREDQGCCRPLSLTRKQPPFLQDNRYYRNTEDGAVTFVIDPSVWGIETRSIRRNRHRWWRWYMLSTLMAFLAYLCYHKPPAPPPSALFSSHIPSWPEFVRGHTGQWLDSTRALLLQTPYALVQYWTRNLLFDLQCFYQRGMVQYASFVVPIISRRSLCQWHVPLHEGAGITSNVWDKNHSILVGQDLAVEWLVNAGYTWQQQQRAGTSDSSTGPLVVLATGYEHTGKRTLAHRMMSRWRTGSRCHGNFEALLLHLPGRDWVLPEYQRDEASQCRRRYQQLIAVIESHIYRMHSRTRDDTFMILITNIEQMEPCILGLFLKNLQNKKDFYLPTHSIEDDEDREEISVTESNVYKLCQNAVIYLTSDTIGVPSIARFLRQGGENRTVRLAADLRDAIHKEWPDATSVIDSILPFLPLTPDTLGQLLQRRLQEYWNTHWQKRFNITLSITDAAVAALLNDNVVEYIELGPRLKLVVEGAAAIPEHPFLNHWYTQLLQVAEGLSLESSGVLVLDYDDRTTTLLYQLHRGVWKLCEEERNATVYLNCTVLSHVRI